MILGDLDKIIKKTQLYFGLHDEAYLMQKYEKLGEKHKLEGLNLRKSIKGFLSTGCSHSIYLKWVRRGWKK